jgi:hypothetical protein
MDMISKAHRQIQIVVHYIVAEPLSKSISGLFAGVFAVVFVGKVVVETDEGRQAILLHCPHSIIHAATDSKIFIGAIEEFYIFRKTDIV